MQFQLYSKNVIVTDPLREYLDIKLATIDRYVFRIVSSRVDLSRDTHHKKGDIFRFEINVNVPGKLVRIVEHHSDMRAAIDIGVDKLQRQLVKLRDKRRGMMRRLRNLRRLTDAS